MTRFRFGALFFSFFFFLPHAQSQAPVSMNVKWGDDLEITRKQFEVGIVKTEEGQFARIVLTRDTLYFNYFGTDLKFTGRKAVPLYNMKVHYSEFILHMKGNDYLVYSSNADRDHAVLLARGLDAQNGRVGGDHEMLVNGRNSGGQVNRFDNMERACLTYGDCSTSFCVLSADSTKVLFRSRNLPLGKDKESQTESGKLIVFNEFLEKQYDANYKLPAIPELTEVRDWCLDSAGSVYQMIRVFENPIKKTDIEEHVEYEKDKSKYNHLLIRYGSNGESPQTIPFELEKGYPVNVHLIDDRKGNVLIAGYYSKEAKGLPNGVFLQKLPHSASKCSPYLKGYYAFSFEEAKAFEKVSTQRKLEKAEKDGEAAWVEYLQLSGISLRADGGLIIIGEQFGASRSEKGGSSFQDPSRAASSSNREVGHSVSYSMFDFNNILALSIQADGGLQWLKKIPKNQGGTMGVAGMSYSFFQKGTTVCFLFMDREKNSAASPDEMPALYGGNDGGDLVCFQINNSGKMTRQIVSPRNGEQQIVPVTILQSTSAGQIFGTGALDHPRHIGRNYNSGIDAPDCQKSLLVITFK
jgi:hypothetical protein